MNITITEDNGLEIKISGDRIKSTLECGHLDMFVNGEFHIRDQKLFIDEFKDYLLLEEEDGRTPIDLLFESVVLRMLEDTDIGCEVIDDD